MERKMQEKLSSLHWKKRKIDEMLKKTKDVIIGSRIAGTIISRKMIIAIGNGVVKPKILREFGESLELTKGGAGNVLKSMY